MTCPFHVNLQGMGSLWSKVEQLANINDNTGDRVRKYTFPELGSPGIGIYIDILQPGLRHTWDLTGFPMTGVQGCRPGRTPILPPTESGAA